MTASNRTLLPQELISAERLQERIGELAAEIDRDYADTETLICIGILKGSIFFMVDLLKKVTILYKEII